ALERELAAYILIGATSLVDESGRVLSPPALRPQIHIFFHGVDNITVCLNCGDLLTDGQRRHIECEPAGLALPLAACTTCREEEAEAETDDDDLINAMEDAPEAQTGEDEPSEATPPETDEREEQSEAKAAAYRRSRVMRAWLCPRCGWVHLQDPNGHCGIRNC